jgi:hypothetical protein
MKEGRNNRNCKESIQRKEGRDIKKKEEIKLKKK